MPTSYAGFSSYPRTLAGAYSTDIIDNIIAQMDEDGLNIYRMSIYYTVDDYTRDTMIQYFLDNCSYDLIVCRHKYDPGGDMSSAEWTAAQAWALDVCSTFSAYENRLWVEFENEAGDSDLATQCQTIVTAIRNAGYGHRLVANKWNQTWASMAGVSDPLNKFYTGYHYYFNSWSVSGAQTQMNTALAAGCLIFNTEIGADFNEETQFSSSEVQEVTDFMAWCADTEYRNIGNAVWQRYGLQNYDTYQSLGLIWPTLSEPVTADVNLAPIFQDGTGVGDGCTWGDYDGTNVYYGTHEDEQICFRDDVVTHSGHSSIRLEAPNEFNLYREVNNLWRTVHPGDRVIFRCYIKTDAGSGNAGIIGFDVYGPTHRILEIHPADPQTGIWYMEDGIPKQNEGSTPVYVEYGSDWALLTLDVTIPSTYYSFNDFEEAIPTQQIAGVIPWLGGVWNGRESYPDIWFADAEMYVNPTEDPPENVTVTAGDDAHSTITPSGEVTVAYGANKTFTFAADEGYVIDSVTVDSVPVAVATSYTFYNVVEAHTIAITAALGEAASPNVLGAVATLLLT